MLDGQGSNKMCGSMPYSRAQCDQHMDPDGMCTLKSPTLRFSQEVISQHLAAGWPLGALVAPKPINSMTCQGKGWNPGPPGRDCRTLIWITASAEPSSFRWYDGHPTFFRQISWPTTISCDIHPHFLPILLAEVQWRIPIFPPGKPLKSPNPLHLAIWCADAHVTCSGSVEWWSQQNTSPKVIWLNGFVWK